MVRSQSQNNNRMHSAHIFKAALQRYANIKKDILPASSKNLDSRIVVFIWAEHKIFEKCFKIFE